MRLHIRGLIAATLAATFTVTACTAPDNKPTCPDQPNATGCTPSATAGPDTTTDIVIRNASFRRIIRVANDTLGSNVEARFVAKGHKESCKLLGDDFSVRGEEAMVIFCGEGYIVMPEGVNTDREWLTKPAMGIWYEVALEVVQAQPAYDGDILKASCTAAHVVTRKLNYQRNVDGEELLAYLASAEYGPDAIMVVRSGLDAAAASQPANTCKNSR